MAPSVALGAVLPFEDLFILPGSTHASVPVTIFLKTHMAEDTTAEREIAVGKFKLLYPSASCSIVSDEPVLGHMVWRFTPRRRSG